MRIIAVVEGHGEVAAVPILLRRLVSQLRPGLAVEVPHPIRVPRSRLLRADEIERVVQLAGAQSTPDDSILVILDANGDCPHTLAPALLQRARKARSDRRVEVIMAKEEFEAWFLAAAESLRGRRMLRNDLSPPADPEGVGDAKGWLSRGMTGGRSYSETLDQPALAAVMDLEAARAAPSFDKLRRAVEGLL